MCLPVATPCRIPVFLPSILISDWAGERAETTWKSEASSGRTDPAPRVRCSWVSCHLSVKISQRYLAAMSCVLLLAMRMEGDKEFSRTPVDCWITSTNCNNRLRLRTVRASRETVSALKQVSVLPGEMEANIMSVRWSSDADWGIEATRLIRVESLQQAERNGRI